MKCKKGHMRICLFAGAVLITPSMSQASEPELAVSNIALAQVLTNPLADLMTIPIQMNFDDNYGVDDTGSKITTNIQPVVPFDIGKDQNLITRTIIHLVHQDEVVPGTGTRFGLGDINQQLFLSPKKTTPLACSGALVRFYICLQRQIRLSEQRSGEQGQHVWF